MMLLGKKLNMTQIFDDNGNSRPVTAIESGPLTVTQVKVAEKDGYSAVQFGYEPVALGKADKPEKGRVAKVLKDKATAFRFYREMRNKDKVSDLKVGDVVPVSSVKEGDKVTISAVSKGKGFQSVIKRHGFKGQPRSHGQKHSEHAPGSIGGGLRNKVPKGMRMAGRTGGDRVTVKNLRVVKIVDNTLFLEGAIPGRKGSLVEIYAGK